MIIFLFKRAKYIKKKRKNIQRKDPNDETVLGFASVGNPIKTQSF